MTPKKNNTYRIRQAIVLCIIFLYASISFSMEEQHIEKEYPLFSNGKVDLKNTSGNISIEGWDREKIKITAIQTAENKEGLDNITIEIDASEDIIRISEKHKKTLGVFQTGYACAHFKLFTPYRARVKIDTTNGNIIAKNLGNRIEVKSICGDVTIQNTDSDARIKTISGSIQLKDIKGNANLKTTSGAISVDGIKGNLEAENVSGNINLHNVMAAGQVEIETISGDILLTGPINDSGTYELLSHCGDITLKLPGNSHFELQAKSFSGEIQYDFDMKNIGKVNAQKFHGISGKGGASLVLSSFSGNIQVEKQ